MEEVFQARFSAHPKISRKMSGVHAFNQSTWLKRLRKSTQTHAGTPSAETKL
jgi:butyrate kinase